MNIIQGKGVPLSFVYWNKEKDAIQKRLNKNEYLEDQFSNHEV